MFKDGYVITFNEEIACRQKTKLKLTGAVQAQPLLALLRKLPEDRLELEVGDSELLVHGKKRRSGIRMETEILLPIDGLEKPKDWKDLPEEFGEAVGIVLPCVGKDESKYWQNCIHLHPKWLEACDNHQIARYRLKTPFNGKSIVRGESLKHIIDLDMTEFCDTETWIHFRNPSGLILSCRRDTSEEYRDLSEYIKVEGEPITLPKGLADAAEKAQIFSSENVDDDLVTIELKRARLRIRGESGSGWYSEVKKIKYDGPDMSFVVSPKMIMDLTKRHTDCVIGERSLMVKSGKYTYVVSLENEEEQKNDEESSEEVDQE